MKKRTTGCRTCLYILLGMMVLFGIGLSAATEHMVREVIRTLGTPLQRDVPALQRFAEFKSALLLHQATLDHYFSSSIDLGVYDDLERQTLSQLSMKDPVVVAGLVSSVERAALQDGLRRIEGYGPALRAALTRKPADVHAAERVLAQSNADTTALRVLADRSMVRIGERLHAEDRAAMTRSGTVAMLVHAYIAFALLGMLFMLYHVRARIRSEDTLAYLATHDELTRLPHRWAFIERVQMQRAKDRHLLLFEADRFERVGADVGPAYADDLVRGMATRAGDVAREAQADLFRLGDSKFAIVLDTRACMGTEEVALRLQERFGEVIIAGAHEIYLSASVGSSDFNDGSALCVLRNAETALHRARQQGGVHIAYSQQLDDLTRSNLALEADLRHAISRGELELYYQPQQRLANRRLIGFEALLRWRRAGTYIAPSDFIPLAEETGIIVEIGDWVLRTACRQAHAWNIHAQSPVTVAINISPRQFAQPSFLDRLRFCLEQSGVAPNLIELEITEGMLMESGERSATLLAQIRALGVRLSVDDFGTGYSSLAYLKRFPLDKLKIDQTFVRQLRADSDDEEIVKAVISLGHNLGFEVIAEGVETNQQVELLARWQCDEIQGFYYGKPMPVDIATAFIEKSPQDMEAVA